MIVVTTPTGHIGSQVVQELLGANAAVRVIARDPARIAPAVREKAEVVQGSSDDEGVLMSALEGAESFFLVVPPSFRMTDVMEHYLRFTRSACRAIQKQGVKRVVTVSGLGRGVDVKAGPVTASFAKDEEIERTGVDCRALWCPGFMENMLRQVEPLRREGVFFATSRGDLKSPQVATRDIAASAARLLLDRSWAGRGGVAVLGPEDLSYDGMAEIMSDALGRTIRFQRVTIDAYRAQMIQIGASAAVAEALIEMFIAKDDGLDTREPRTSENTTPTSFRQWCEEVLKPAIREEKQ